MSTALGLGLNLIALVLVVGMCWAALMWMGRRSAHGVHPPGHSDPEERDIMTGVRFGEGASRNPDFDAARECATCEGVGASSKRGRVVPCTECQGSGVR